MSNFRFSFEDAVRKRMKQPKLRTDGDISGMQITDLKVSLAFLETSVPERES